MGVGSQRRHWREAGTEEVQSGGEPGAEGKAGIAVKAGSGGSATRQVPAVQPVRGAHPEGRHRQPRHDRVQLPAGLQRRIPLRQDLEAALEEPHVPVPQEIQPFSFSAPRQSVVLRGRHAAPEATPHRDPEAVGARSEGNPSFSQAAGWGQRPARDNRGSLVLLTTENLSGAFRLSSP